MSRRKDLIAMTTIAMLATSAFASSAAATVVSGALNDPADVALIASDGYEDLHAPRFGSDAYVARNIAVYALTVATPGLFEFASSGYALGGAQPYLSLFSGSDAAATFVGSSYADPAIDFDDTFALAVGRYLVTIGVYVNESFAENDPDADPTFGDGFTALGDPTLLGSSFYQLAITSNDGSFMVAPSAPIVSAPPSTNIPEPSTGWLAAIGGTGLLSRRRCRTATRRPA